MKKKTLMLKAAVTIHIGEDGGYYVIKILIGVIKDLYI
jgi:hypothetical protein